MPVKLEWSDLSKQVYCLVELNQTKTCSQS